MRKGPTSASPNCRMAITPAAMRQLDETAVTRYGIPGLILMENAGAGLVRALMRDWKNWGCRQAVIMAGKGGNGGDGFVAARHLHNHGIPTRVVLVGAHPGAVSGDAGVNLTIVQRMRIPVLSWKVGRRLNEDDAACLWLDALLGTGFSGTLTGEVKEAITKLKRVKGPVVAVDIPSGLSGKDGLVTEVAVAARKTFTFGLMKSGLLAGAGPTHAGEVEVVEISWPRELVEEITKPNAT